MRSGTTPIVIHPTRILLEEWVGGAKLDEMFFGTFQFVRDRGQSLEDTSLVLAVMGLRQILFCLNEAHF